MCFFDRVPVPVFGHGLQRFRFWILVWFHRSGVFSKRLLRHLSLRKEMRKSSNISKLIRIITVLLYENFAVIPHLDIILNNPFCIHIVFYKIESINISPAPVVIIWHMEAPCAFHNILYAKT